MGLVVIIVVAGCASTTDVDGAKSDQSSKGGLLFVQRADGGSVSTDATGAILTLSGLDPTTTWFTDRPARRAGTMSSESFVAEWATHFGADDPNAVVDLADPSATDVTVALHPLSIDGASITYRISVVDGSERLPSSMASVSLFIDDGDSAVLPVTFTFSNVMPGDQISVGCGSPGMTFASAPFGSAGVELSSQAGGVMIDQLSVSDSTISIVTSAATTGAIPPFSLQAFLSSPVASSVLFDSMFDPWVEVTVSIGGSANVALAVGITGVPIPD